MTDSQKLELGILVESHKMLEACNKVVDYIGWRPELSIRVKIIIDNYRNLVTNNKRLEELEKIYHYILV